MPQIPRKVLEFMYELAVDRKKRKEFYKNPKAFLKKVKGLTPKNIEVILAAAQERSAAYAGKPAAKKVPAAAKELTSTFETNFGVMFPGPSDTDDTV
jgi:hypothetical protein